MGGNLSTTVHFAEWAVANIQDTTVDESPSDDRHSMEEGNAGMIGEQCRHSGMQSSCEQVQKRITDFSD